MDRVTIDFHKALNILTSWLSTQNNQENENELPAMITNWLQRPEGKPVLYGAADTEKWKQILIRYSLFEKGLIDIASYERKISLEAELIISYDSIPFPPPKKHIFTFVDLFAGIGGFRIGLQQLGVKCVFSCDWNNSAKKTYYKNFGEVPFGDIRQFTSPGISDRELDEIIPDHNILTAGFPCQPFSKAGISARNHRGRRSGFYCEEQGNLFFDIVRIIKVKQPDVIFLENVRSLISHDRGKTFNTIKELIEQELQYGFKYDIIDSSSLVPQRRERCYIVCFKRKDNGFKFPRLIGEPQELKSILENEVPEKYTISNALWQGHIERTRRNLARGTGFTAYVADLKKPSHTLVARYGKDGKECLIPQEGRNPRKLTPRECARLQGFPESFVLADSDTPAYRQLGNAVPVPVIIEIGKNIIRELKEPTNNPDANALQQILL